MLNSDARGDIDLARLKKTSNGTLFLDEKRDETESSGYKIEKARAGERYGIGGCSSFSNHLHRKEKLIFLLILFSTLLLVVLELEIVQANDNTTTGNAEVIKVLIWVNSIIAWLWCFGLTPVIAFSQGISQKNV